MQMLCYQYIGLYQYYHFGYANTLCVHYPLFFFLIFFTFLPKLMMLAQKSIAAKEHVSITSATFILCMLQLIRIAHQKCTTQCSESPYATILALMNTFVKNFLLQHVFCFLNIATQTYYVIASTPFILCMLHVIRIAHPNVSIQHSESQKAYTITLSKIFILMQIFMLTHPPNIKVKNETADTCNIMSAIILKNITPQTPTDDTDR